MSPSVGEAPPAEDRSEAVQNPDIAIRENSSLQQRLRDRPRRELSVGGSTNHKLYTKAAIVLAREIVELPRIKIDGTGLHNLLPRSIARKLGLPLYFGTSVRVRLANRTVLTDQYCQLETKAEKRSRSLSTPRNLSQTRIPPPDTASPVQTPCQLSLVYLLVIEEYLDNERDLWGSLAFPLTPFLKATDFIIFIVK
jgi:hypothetical protein